MRGPEHLVYHGRATLKYLFACHLSATQYGGSIFTCENVCLLLASKRFRFLVRNFALIWDVILTKTNWMRHLSVARLRLFSFRRCQEHKNTSKNHLCYSKYWVPMYYGGIQIKSSFDTLSLLLKILSRKQGNLMISYPSQLLFLV